MSTAAAAAAAAIAGTLILLLVAIIVSSLTYRRHRYRISKFRLAGKRTFADEVPSSVKYFSWSEVESLTGGFSTSIVGEGGSSTVYLAERAGGGAVAVKVVGAGERLRRAFLGELHALRRVHHPRIVSLIGFSDEREQRALVLDYVPNGNLHEKLHGAAADGALTWHHRLTIAADLAAALEYLHDVCDPPIIHGDLKSANILLEDSLLPKLCDFGSSISGFSAAVVLPISGVDQVVVGSPGYVDPHYLRTGILSKKSDIYSFGVLLLEVITGGEASSPATGERLLVARAAEKLGGGGAAGVSEIVDPTLAGKYDPGEVAAAAEIALSCVGEQPSQRPSMAEVAKALREMRYRSSIVAVDSKSDGRKEISQLEMVKYL